MVMERDMAMAANAKERRGRSEERASYRTLQHRPQAPLPASRTSSRTLSSANSAPALLMPVRAAPHVQRLPSPLSLPTSRSPSRSRRYEEDSDDVDSPTSSVSSSSSASTDSASGDEAAVSPYTPPHALPLPYGSTQQHPSALPKLMLPPHAAKYTHRGQVQHKRSHAHARIAPYPSLSLPPTRTSSPAAAASAYAYAVPAPPPVSATASGSMLLPPASKLMLPPPGTHGLYPSCIVSGPYAS